MATAAAPMEIPAIAPVPRWLPDEELLDDVAPEVEVAEVDEPVSEGNAWPGVIW